MKTMIALTLLATTSLSFGNPALPTNNLPAKTKGTISVQEMLLSGPPQLKMHSLAMISQGNIKGGIDESFIPGLKSCAKDPSAPLRSISAKLLGENFIMDKETPNSDVIIILQKLAKDDSSDVRFNATYYGLARIKNITPELAEQLIDIAAKERNPALQDQIIVTLANYKPQVVEILDQKLAGDNSISYFEIYEEFTGNKPANTEKYLDMPSSRPRMFIFSGSGDDPDSAQAELTKELKAVGLQNPSVKISGTGNNYALIVKTYITKEGLAVEKNFSGAGKFQITQQMWLSPELEAQLEAMQKANKNK